MAMNSGRKATQLVKRLKLGEISLVDDGDNPGADVLIIKARGAAGSAAALLEDFQTEVENGGYDEMNLEEIQKRLGEIETALATAEAERDTAVEKARVAETALAAVTTERDEAIAKAKAPDAETDADIYKGMSPAAKQRFIDLEKSSAASAAALAAIELTRETDTAIAKARTFGIGDADKVGGLLVRIAKGKTTPEDAGVVEDILKQAKTVAERGEALFKSVGGRGSVKPDSEEAQLDEATKAIQKAKPALSYEQAYSEALDANPALYGAMVAKHRAAQQGAH